VEVRYDRESGHTFSRPPRPELEVLVAFAVAVRDEWQSLRDCQFCDRILLGLLDTQRRIVMGRPGDELARAQLVAIEREIARRASLGPIAQAQRDGGDVRGRIAADLWAEV
jgi:hypothetical protein